MQIQEQRLLSPGEPYHYHESFDPSDELWDLERSHEVPPKFPPMFVRPPLKHVLLTLVLVAGLVLSLTVFKDDLEHKFGITSEHILKFSSIPVTSIVFTYCHIWWALWMTFYPIQFFGCCQIPGTNVGLGWQGIIPSKAEKMARMSVKLMTTQLLDVKAIFSKLDPVRMAKEMEPVLRRQLEEIIDEMAQRYVPKVWSSIPMHVRREIVDAAFEDVPEVVIRMNRDLQERIEEVFDLEEMVVEQFVRDKELLCDTFIRCGYRELAFIRNSGAYMGLLFGLGQMVAWIFYQAQWVLPVIGLVVGALTNWLALKMIFSPVEPVRCCGFTIQGLFLQRQDEVAMEYGRIVSTQILTSRQILAGFFAGPAAQQLNELVRGHIEQAMDRFVKLSPRLVEMTKGQDLLLHMKAELMTRLVSEMPAALVCIEKYADESLDICNTLQERMRSLPSKQFERLLHPVFEEDEWKLVLLGGVLGVAVGVVQAYVLKTD